MAGLLTGTLMRRLGWQVDIYERSAEELSSRGAGIVTHPELFEALERGGVELEGPLGVEIPGRLSLARDGGSLGRLALPQTVTSWDRLYRALRNAFPGERYHVGRPVRGFEQSEAAVRVHLAGGERVTADLLIAADGIRSKLRSQVLAEVAPAYAGYVGWRGLVDEAALSDPASRRFTDWLGFCLPEHEQMLGYPVAGADGDLRPGRRRYNWVWYRPAEGATALADLLTDAAGRRYDVSVPPGRIRPEIIARLRESAADLLAPQFAQVVARTERPFFQPIYDLESPHMVFGRVLLLGDAAFVARPHVGMGVTKAAGDALALARACHATDHDITAALSAWETPRLAFGRAVVARGRALGADLETRARGTADPRPTERARAAQAMSTIAIADAIRV